MNIKTKINETKCALTDSGIFEAEFTFLVKNGKLSGFKYLTNLYCKGDTNFKLPVLNKNEEIISLEIKIIKKIGSDSQNYKKNY